MELYMDPEMRKRTKRFAIGLIIVGLIGVILPQVISMTLSFLIALMLILAGILTGYLTWLNYSRSALAWLKPFLLLSLGLLVVFNPVAGAAALGLLLVIYFLFDGFAGISFALMIRPMPGWVWTLINGIVSLLLAAIFLASWPFGSVWLVGLLVGISLIIDGLALLGLVLSAESK